MKRSYWLIAFAVVLLGDLIGIQVKSQLLQYVCKPLIVPLIGAYFLLQTRVATTRLKGWIIAALFFSWVGDLLLMFDTKAEIYFLLGLSSFLIAHLFYILFFHHIRIKENIRSNLWLLWIVVIYYVALITVLSPYLGDKKIPVRVYGLVISFMFMLAMHMLFINDKIAGRWMMAGALLFVLSDSVLAVNKFYCSFEGAGSLIILTYGLAQFFIANGAGRYIMSVDSIIAEQEKGKHLMKREISNRQ